MNDLVGFVEVNEPGMIAYHMYFSEKGTRMTVFQVHPDSTSAEYHLKPAATIFFRFVEFITISRIDIYDTQGKDLWSGCGKMPEC